MSRHLPLLPCLGLALVLAASPAPLVAQGVQRCIDASGRPVFTDQRCADIGAVSLVPPATALPASGGVVRRGPLPGGCPRTAAQLAGELGAAVRAGDSNRLAGLYDWVGVSGATASRVLDRLERIAARPLVDVAPVLAHDRGQVEVTAAVPELPLAPEPPATAPPVPSGPERWLPSWIPLGGANARDAGDAARPETPAAPATLLASAAPTPPQPRTVGLRVEQTLPGSATPSRTVFGMQRRFGCLWLRL